MSGGDEALTQEIQAPVEIVELPLYDRRPISDDAIFAINAGFSFECYCAWCKRESHFKTRSGPIISAKGDPPRTLGGSSMIPQRVFRANDPRWLTALRNQGRVTVIAECGRDSDHEIFFTVWLWDGHIEKFGQLPSLMDIAAGNLREFSGVAKENVAELRRAVGLHAHGIGVGSFVYLRRIFERLLLDAANERGTADQKFKIDKWKKLRSAEEKIAEVREFLPKNFGSNATPLYGLLSKTIHELTEDEALRFFPPLRALIELALKDAVAAKERKKLEASLARELNAIQKEIKQRE